MAYDLLNTFSVLLFLNGVFAFSLAVYAASFQKQTASTGLVGVLVGAGLWSVGDGLRIAAPTAAEVLFWNKMTYVGVACIPPAILVFVAAYTDHDRWLRRRRLGALVAVSVVMVLVVFTNQWHGLWRPDEVVMPGTGPPVLDEELGVLHLLWIGYVLFGIVPVIYVFLLGEFRSAESVLFRRQIGLILASVTAPAILSILYVTGATPIDFTPFGFAAFGLVLTVAIMEYRVLKLLPVARDVVVENLDSGVLVLDRDGRVVDANPRAVDMIAGPREEIVGERATDLFDEYDEVVDALQSVEDASTTLSIEANGETAHYHTSFSPMRDDGEFLGRVVVFSDITERVTRQQQLVEQTTALEEKNERLDRFASMVSHDLRNPLNVATLRLDQARETGDEEALAAAADAVARMERMTEQLLTLARTGRDIEDTGHISLRPAVDRAWEAVGDQDATLDCADDLGTVTGDPDLVLELFENLFRNAIEHNDDGVTIRVGRTEDGFFVADDGSGIEQSERDQVFDHGYTTADHGTGFGLAIVADIVDAHGWNVTIEDSDDGGARFEIQTVT